MNQNISKEEIVSSYFWLWPLFCLQAGLINSAGFLACHRFVSHVTGFGTRVGTEFLEGNYLLGAEMLLIPLGFILGSMVAGYFTEVMPKKGKKPNFLVPLSALSALLAMITAFGTMNFFGIFGEPLVLQRDILLLTLLCFSCGLMNATIASITGGAVRVTHLTGVATDLGLNATRLLFNKDKIDYRWFKLRLLKMSFFGSGATLGTVLFYKLEYMGFMIPALFNLILMWQWSRIKSRNNLNVCPVPHQCNEADVVVNCS